MMRTSILGPTLLAQGSVGSTLHPTACSGLFGASETKLEVPDEWERGKSGPELIVNRESEISGRLSCNFFLLHLPLSLSLSFSFSHFSFRSIVRLLNKCFQAINILKQALIRSLGSWL